MFRTHRSLLLIAALLTAPVYGACAADNGTPGPGVTNNGARLEIIGSGVRAINEYAEHEIEVRYVSNTGATLEGVVDFAIEGDAAGASLSGSAAATDSEGHARVTLRAGSSTNFDVVAVAPNADPAVIGIQVQQMRFANIDYTVVYSGRRVVDTAEVALFTNITCDELNRTVPTPRETQYTRLRRAEKFEAVETGIPVALYALGIDRRDNVAAEACEDVRLDEGDKTVEIVIDDTAELFGGEWDISETFDVTAGFNPTLDLLLDILSGLATDPAGYIVDYVATNPSTPSWLRTALGSSVTRNLVADLIRDAIRDIHVPGYLVEVVEFGHGVDTAFTQLTFDGRLTFDEPDEFGVSMGSHRITRMSFPTTHDGGISEHVIGDAYAEVLVTVGPTIELDEHTFRIPFGQVVEMIIHDVLLPRVPGSPTTTGGFLRDLLDCEGIAAALGGGSTTTVSIANSVCDIGLTVLGGLIEGYITEMWQYDEFTLTGTAELTDSDQDYDRDTLVDGHADVSWMGDTGTLDFTGTFAGSRVGDTEGRQHRIRERMTGLR